MCPVAADAGVDVADILFLFVKIYKMYVAGGGVTVVLYVIIIVNNRIGLCDRGILK